MLKHRIPTHHHLVCELHAFCSQKDAWLLVTQYSLNYYHPVAITPPAARNVTIYAAVPKTLRDSQQFDDVATVLFSDQSTATSAMSPFHLPVILAFLKTEGLLSLSGSLSGIEP
jgi:hypothetical protein